MKLKRELKNTTLQNYREAKVKATMNVNELKRYKGVL